MLATVVILAVTQARASGNYAYAIGGAPSKDYCWITLRAKKKGNKWGDNSTELDPRLQASVLTLTKGPVCPCNKIGVSNHPYLKRSWIRKWVGVSKASMERVTTASDSDVTVVVQGSPKEMVTLTFVPPTGESTMDM
eukprot:g9313.t1